MKTKSGWIVEFLNATVQADGLATDLRSRLFRCTLLVEEEGLEALPRGWVKPLGNKLWELRLSGRDGIARAIYITAVSRRLVIVRVFVKKTEKTPPRELKIARDRAKEVE